MNKDEFISATTLPENGVSVNSTIVVLMGVSGSGKTTIGTLLAQTTGVLFVDADDYHSAANKEKMAAGTPLTDEDRGPWLATLHGVLREWDDRGVGGVMACSALKQAYRETLERGIPVRFVLLDGAKAMIEDRLAHRSDSFMNPKLLDSQIAALEVPEDALRVINDRAPEMVVAEIVRGLGDSHDDQ